MEIRVPTLGAFALNKANTFHLRGGQDGDMKSGKDLLYLRDILAAGERAVAVLEGDLDAITMDPRNAETIRRGAYHLHEVVRRYLDPTAEILAERDGVDMAAARADIEGYLTDMGDIFGRLAEE